MMTYRTISLVKAPPRYVFRYSVGFEADVVSALASMASDENMEFDWFDAAVLSYQMGRRLEMHLEEQLPDQL